MKVKSQKSSAITPSDISLQDWTWGNDYRPGTDRNNLIYIQQQLSETGQLKPGSWRGGLRVASLKQAEQLAQGYFYWLMAGTTDSPLVPSVKHLDFRLPYLRGLTSPRGTIHGPSKYPYIQLVGILPTLLLFKQVLRSPKACCSNVPIPVLL